MENKGFSANGLGNAYWLHLYPEKPLGALKAVETISIKTLHECMGHLHWDAIKHLKIDSTPPFTGVALDASDIPKGTCPGCAAGKGKRPIFKSRSGPRSSRPFKCIHADLTGPFDEAIGGYCYACVFNDDCSRHVWVYYLKTKDQTLRTFRSFVSMVENQTGYQLVFFQSDRGGEFMSKEFDDFLEEKGITRKTSAPETPQQNGLAERMMQTLKGGSRALLTHSGMSKGFWVEAMRTATHVLNHSPRKGLEWHTPYELFYGHVPNISYFRTFGCRTWAYDERATKWDPKMKPLIFVSYETGSKAYRLWDPSKRSIVISAKVRFDETVLPNKPEANKPVASSSKQKLPSPPPDEDFITFPFTFNDEDEKSDSKKKKPLPPPPCSPSPPFSRSPSPDPPPSSTVAEPPSAPLNLPSEAPKPGPSQPRRTIKPVERYGDKPADLALAGTEGAEEPFDQEHVYLSQVQLLATSNPNGEPTTFLEALASKESDKWIQAMKEEVDSLRSRRTWVLAPRPEN